MTEFTVWAPKAGQVHLVNGPEQLSMQPAAGGWWKLEQPAAGPGNDYAFLLDGQGPFPDPRSRWQPEGVHGPSRLLDPSAFSWTDDGWQAPPLSSALIYELHIGTFTPEGTFEAAIRRLDYLQELGVTHVELMPVAEFSGNRGWGYDSVDLYAPHSAYGGPFGLQLFVDACHQRGLAVLLDVVYNHLGPDGNYLRLYGPYFTDRYATPWGEAVNFDGPHSDEVVNFFLENAEMWLRDYHIDGLRLDAVHAIIDRSAFPFLERLADRVDQLSGQLGRRLVLIAESSSNDPRLTRSRDCGGIGIDAQWSDDFHHALHTVLTGENTGYYRSFGSLADLAKTLTQAFVYDGQYSEYRQRRHGRPPLGLPASRFLGYIQTHDQVGNRAQGERIGHLVGLPHAKIAAALVLTAPFVPMIFQGEEWGASAPFLYFTDLEDQELAQAVSRGRKEEFSSFGWKPDEVPDPQAVETFRRSKLDWAERERGPHAEILSWYRCLIQLRRDYPVLANGRFDPLNVQFDEAAAWLVMERGEVTVAVNLSETDQTLSVIEHKGKSLHLISEAGIRLEEQGLVMSGNSAAILVPA